MTVYVADRFTGDACIFDGELQCALHGFGLGRGEVIAVGVCTETDKFGVDFCATGLRVFVFFEDERAAAFANDESVAVPVVAGGGEFGVFVPSGCGE